ncbi:hypothetical protein CYY_004573 [Polysphondylium violaceum]|uniref:ATPase AAA-type core domain-containing protein n=1 Tax=Polysphondylium violaceum TaxID=133409 RepID=A0A8J4USX6_9MYCE|nr:hypothetical protein CYY_004573 [Polysphondylium violaceum]
MPPDSNDTDSLESWKSKIRNFVYGYRAFSHQDPLAILKTVCEDYIHRKMHIKSEYKDIKNIYTLWEFYKKTEENCTNLKFEYFFKDLGKEEFRNQVMDSFIEKELNVVPPWKEVNTILKNQKFPFLLEYKENNRNFVLKNEKEKEISVNDLSSGEEVILKLLVHVLYYMGFSTNGKNPAQLQNLDIMLLDEPDGHLDPENLMRFIQIIKEEFVKKRNVQVFMTTHRIDSVLLSKTPIFTIEMKPTLLPNGESVINGISHVVTEALNDRTANTILSGETKVTALENTNLVFTENEDDEMFYNIAYKKLKSGCPQTFSNNTDLNFMKVGNSVDISKDVDDLKELKKDIKNLKVETTDISKLAEILKSMEKVVNSISSKRDNFGGSNQVKAKVKGAFEYNGVCDEHGIAIKRIYRSKTQIPLGPLFGIIDKDNRNTSDGQVCALEVYSFENYLCMPLNLFYMIRYNPGLECPETADIFKTRDNNLAATKEELQLKSDLVFNFLVKSGKSKIFTENINNEKNNTEIILINGYSLVINRAFQETKGHDLVVDIGGIILNTEKKRKAEIEKKNENDVNKFISIDSCIFFTSKFIRSIQKINLLTKSSSLKLKKKSN